MRVLAAAVLALSLACAGSVAARDVVVTDSGKGQVPAPLIVVLHGFTGTGASMQRKTRFDAVAEAAGWIVAYPSGTARRWDADGAASADVAYLEKLIRGLIAQGRADPSRVYLAGHSNGGAMALRMACAHPRLIRAIAVVAMNAPRAPYCTGPPPMPALFIHGSLDPIVPPAGLPARHWHGGYLSTADTLGRWARRNGCEGPAPAQVFDQTAGADTAAFIPYRRCDAPLLQIRLTGQGHEWPGAGPRARWLQGPASRELDAAAAIWRFFAQL